MPSLFSRMIHFWQSVRHSSNTTASRRGHGMVALALLIAGLGFYWVNLLSNHQQKIDALQHQTDLRAGQIAKVLAVQAQTQFSALDFVAQNLVAEYTSGDTDGFDRAVQTATASYPQGSILQIAVADHEGHITYSSLQKPPRQASGASIADREHFLVHARSAQSQLYISQPVMGRVSQMWTIQITRAIRVQGRFAGVVVISITPSYLASFFREIPDVARDVIMLLRDDGAYLARSQGLDNAMGKYVSRKLEFLHHPEQVHGTYDLENPIDGVPRHYAWRRVSGLPLRVCIGLDKQAVWAPLRAEIRRSLVVNGISSLLLLLAAATITILAWQRRKAEHHAMRSDALLHNLLAQVPGGLFQLQTHPDGSLQIAYASPGLHKLHQTSHAEVGSDGDALFAEVPQDDHQRIRQALAQPTTDWRPLQMHYRAHGHDGKMHWLLMIAQPERSSDGGLLWHGYVQDVTQEHEMQETLRTNEQHLRLTMEAVHDGLWQWVPGSDQVLWDARCWEMLGYPAQPKELSYTTLLEWMHPSDLDNFKQRVAAHLEHGEFYHCEFRMRTACGGWIWVEARGDVIEPTDGETPRMMVGTHTDISERVTQSQLIRALLNESAAAILLTAPDRSILQVNQRAENIFAAAGTSLIGQSVRILHPDDASFEALGDCYGELREKGSVHLEWQLQMGDGSMRWCDLHGTMLDPNEPRGQVIWTILDADDRHRAEQALHTAQELLTAIIECFPDGVMIQEYIRGPIVAINQTLWDMLGLNGPITQMPPDLSEQIRSLLPADMLQEPVVPSDSAQPQVLRAEIELDERVMEVQRIPLWHEDSALGIFWMVHDITLRKRRESTLEQLATTDTLTRLPNRGAFMERLQHEFNDVRMGDQRPGILLMIDIDFFKKVNDTWGHGVGDQVLQHLATVLRQSLRSSDMAARMGGEEFTVLLPQSNLEDGLQLAERLRLAIANSPAPSDQGPISITVSLRLSVLDATLDNIDQGLTRADAALYTAKHQGRNRVCAWEPGMEVTQTQAEH